MPKGPSRSKKSMESKFATGRKNAMAIAKRYGECSEVFVFIGNGGVKTVQEVENYGGSKMLQIRE